MDAPPTFWHNRPPRRAGGPRRGRLPVSRFAPPHLLKPSAVRAANIGSYVGVPLQFYVGRLYGTVCCMRYSPDPSLRERDAQFMGMLARLVAEQLEREELESERRRLEARATGMGAVLAALVARDGYAGAHSEAVVEHTVALAHRMGLPEEGVDEVEQVTLLHDLGKIGIADAVLSKPGPLNDAEWEIMKTHPAIGEEIVASTKELSHLAPAIRADHERWDGKGYPDGLSGEEIPLASRIVLACDAFHAMISDRPYRKALATEAALGEIRKGAGTQFCPAPSRRWWRCSGGTPSKATPPGRDAIHALAPYSPYALQKLFGKGSKASRPSVVGANKRPIEVPKYLPGGPRSPGSISVWLFQTASEGTFPELRA